MRTSDKLDMLFEEIGEIMGCNARCETECVYPDVGPDVGCPLNQFRASVDYVVNQKLAVEAVAHDVMEAEDNCEDAVNGIAYEAYQRLYGETPMHEMNQRYVDELLYAARWHVRKHGEAYGIEWEEF